MSSLVPHGARLVTATVTFEGRGGLDFVQEADLTGASRYNWELSMDPGRLRIPKVLHRGVEIALGPYLPPRGDR